MQKRIIKLLLVGASVFTLSACSSKESIKMDDKGIIATVGDQNITQRDLNEELLITHGSLALQELLIRNVITQKLDNKYIKEVEDEIDQIIAFYIKDNGGVEAYEGILRADGYDSIEHLKRLLFNQRLIGKYIETTIDTSEEGIKQAMKDNDFSPKVEMKGMLVGDEETAQDAIDQLKNGGDWNEISETINQDYDIANHGGYLPYIQKDDVTLDGYNTPSNIPQEIVELAKTATKTGLVEEPIPSGDGRFYVIYIDYLGDVDNWKENGERLQDQIKSIYGSNQMYVESELGALLKEYNINIKEDRYTHVLSGLYQAAGSYKEMIGSPQNIINEREDFIQKIKEQEENQSAVMEQDNTFKNNVDIIN